MAASSTSQIDRKPLYSGYENPKELHYICPVAHLHSIMQQGLLSRNKVNNLKDIQLTDPSNPEVQDRRMNKSPNKKKSPEEDNLHNYVNLYLNAFNRTLYLFNEANKNICILRIHPKILEQKSCQIADRNAAANSAVFYKSGEFTFDEVSSHILHHDKSYIFNDWVKKKCNIEMDQNFANQIRQAEVLVRSKIPPSYIKGIYVPNENVKSAVIEIFNYPEKITIHPSLFFEYGRGVPLEDVSAPELSDTDVEPYDTTPPSSDNEELGHIQCQTKRILFHTTPHESKSESEND